MKHIILAALVGMLVSGPVWAADPTGDTAVHGTGAKSADVEPIRRKDGAA